MVQTIQLFSLIHKDSSNYLVKTNRCAWSNNASPTPEGTEMKQYENESSFNGLDFIIHDLTQYIKCHAQFVVFLLYENIKDGSHSRKTYHIFDLIIIENTNKQSTVLNHHYLRQAYILSQGLAPTFLDVNKSQQRIIIPMTRNFHFLIPYVLTLEYFRLSILLYDSRFSCHP